MMSKLSKQFYLRDDVIQISRDLIGKVLVSKIDKVLTSGIITETEAYAGITDKASHAYNGKRTNRTEVMYWSGGISYVYLCYGIHNLFNIVTNIENIPHAVLIRAIKPIEGVDQILKRRHQKKLTSKTCEGPGTVSQALGIQKNHNAINLSGNIIWVEDRGFEIPDKNVSCGPRIGVDYAEEDALLPYRFKVNSLQEEYNLFY